MKHPWRTSDTVLVVRHGCSIHFCGCTTAKWVLRHPHFHTILHLCLGVHIDSELKLKKTSSGSCSLSHTDTRSYSPLPCSTRRTHASDPLQVTGATSPRIRELRVGSIQPDRPEEAGEGAEKGNSTDDKASSSVLRRQTEKPAATLLVLQVQTR